MSDPTVLTLAAVMQATGRTVVQAEDLLIAAGVPEDRAQRAADAVTRGILADFRAGMGALAASA
jgi:hypothetical protein